MFARRRTRGSIAALLATALVAGGAFIGGSAAYAEELPADPAAEQVAPQPAEAPVVAEPAAEAPAAETPVEAPVPAAETPAAAPAAAVTAEPAVAAATEAGLTVQTQLTGVPTIGAYVAVIEQGTASELSQENMGLAMEYVRTPGAATSTLEVAAANLDRAKQYEVVTWQAHTIPSADTIYVVAPLAVSAEQWDAVFGPVEPEVPAATIAASVTGATEAGLTVSVQLDDVVIPTGKFGAYVGVVEKDRVAEYGTDAGAGMVEAYLKPSAFTNGSATQELVVPVEKKDRTTGEVVRTLDRAKEYVVVSWFAHGFLTDEVKVGQTDLAVSGEQWDAVFGPVEPEVPAATIAASVTGATEAGLTVSVQLDDVVIPTGKFGAYVGVVEKDRVAEYGTDAGAGMVEAYLKPSAFTNGSATQELVVPVEKKDRTTGEVVRTLDRAKEYVVVSWFAHGFLTDEVKVGQTDLAVSGEQWDAVFGPVEPEVPATPELTVAPNEDLDRAGASVTVTGAGYDPSKSIYVTPCADIELADLTFDYINAGCTSGAKLVWAHGAVDKNGEPRALQFAADGSFEVTMDVAPRGDEVVTSLFTLRDHNDRADRSQDAKVVLGFTDPAPTGPQLTAQTAITANEKIDVNVSGTGFDDVKLLPGQQQRHVYLALVEQGMDLSKLDQSGDSTTIAADVADDGTVVGTLTETAVNLDRSKQYEVISWPSRSQPTEQNLYARVAVQIDWNALFPAEGGTKVTAKVTKVLPGEGFNVDIKATDLPIESGFAYVAVIEKGTANSLDQDADYPAMNPFAVVKGSSLSLKMLAAQKQLDRTRAYEVLVWKQHSQPSADTIYGSADLAISNAQWDELLKVKPKPEPEPKPTPTPVAPTPGQQQPGSLIWGVSSGFANYATGPIAKGSVTTSGVGGGSGGYVFPQASSSWDAASQTGSVQYSGVVTFTGHKGLMSETFSNPVITVSSATSGTISAGGSTFTLNLGAAGKSVGANGEVTWSGVPVSGAISGGGSGSSGTGGGSFGIDPVTFTVGAVNHAGFGSTTVASTVGQKRTAAATPPATTGITILTDAEDIVPGGEIELEATGFEASERDILVVLYSDPTVLDDNAGANKAGTVRWIGTLPDDIEPGEHTLTLQGSTDAGAKITVLDKKQADAKKKDAKKKVAAIAAEAESGQLQAAGLSDTGTPMWVWWAGSLLLLLIAGGTTGLVVAQRRGAGSD